jgi:hypothetical protein
MNGSSTCVMAMHHADAVVDQRQRRIDQAERHQRLVDDAVVLQDDHPGGGAHQKRGPQRQQHGAQHHRPLPALKARRRSSHRAGRSAGSTTVTSAAIQKRAQEDRGVGRGALGHRGDLAGLVPLKVQRGQQVGGRYRARARCPGSPARIPASAQRLSIGTRSAGGFASSSSADTSSCPSASESRISGAVQPPRTCRRSPCRRSLADLRSARKAACTRGGGHAAPSQPRISPRRCAVSTRDTAGSDTACVIMREQRPDEEEAEKEDQQRREQQQSDRRSGRPGASWRDHPANRRRGSQHRPGCPAATRALTGPVRA